MIRLFNAEDTNFDTIGEKVIKPIDAKITRNEDEFYLDITADLTYIDYLRQDNIIVVDGPYGRMAFRISNPEKDEGILSIKANCIYEENKIAAADRGLVLRDGINTKSVSLSEDWDNVVTTLKACYEDEVIVTLVSDISYQVAYERNIDFTLSDDIKEQVDLKRQALSSTESEKDTLEDSIAKLVTKKETFSSTIQSLTTELQEIRQKLTELGSTETENQERLKLEAEIPVIEAEIQQYQADMDSIDGIVADTTVALSTVTATYDNLTNELTVLINQDIKEQAEAYLSENEKPQISYSIEIYLDKLITINDTVNLVSKSKKIDLMLHVSSYTYDCLNGVYTEVELGAKRKTLKSRLESIEENVEKNKETAKDILKAVSIFSSEYKRDEKELISRFTEEMYGNEGLLGIIQKTSSLIRQTAGSILLQVDQILQNYSTTTEMKSSIELTAQGITQSVSKTLSNYSTTTEMKAQIKLSADSITSTVSESINGIQKNISVVEQTASKISWLVKSGTSESNFSLTDRVATLIAEKLNITSYVTFTNLKTSGATVIDGSNITTGTINADLIKAGKLNGITITNGDITIENGKILISSSEGYLQAKNGSSIINLIGFDDYKTIVIGNTNYGSSTSVRLYGKEFHFGYQSNSSNATKVYVNGYEVLTEANMASLLKASKLIDSSSNNYPTISLTGKVLKPSSGNAISLGTSSNEYSAVYAASAYLKGNVELGSSVSSKFGVFGSSGATKTVVADMGSNYTLATVYEKLAELINALQSYGLV